MSTSLHLDAEQYFREYAALVYRRALVLLGNASDADDAVQEVFIRALANRGRFRGESKTSTWLYRITTNYCLNLMRNSGRRLELLREHHGEQPTLPGAPAPDDAVVLRGLLSRANPDQAAAAIYVFVDGMTRPEAAHALGVSLRTVGNLLTRFTAWARDELGSGPGAAIPRFLEESAASVPETASSSVKSTGRPL